MRRLALVGMVSLVCLVPATATMAADEQGELTVGVVIGPGDTDGILILTKSPTRLTPGPLEGDVHEKDGAPSWAVAAVDPAACEGVPARASGISGVPVCLVVANFPSATAATGTVRLAPTSTLKLAINSHHPRWIALAVTLGALLLGAWFAFLAAIWIPRRRQREDLESAIDDAIKAGLEGVPEWLAALPPSVDEITRTRLLRDATSTLIRTLTDERLALRRKLASLAKYGDLVDADFTHPDVSGAAAEADSTSLPVEQLYNTKGEPVAPEASRWRAVVHQLMLIASQIVAFQSLLPDLPQPERHRANNAADAYVDKFRNLVFADPEPPFPHLEGMNEELGQLFKEYAPHVTSQEIPTAGLAPPSPPPGPPLAAPRASSAGVARLVIGAVAVVAVVTVFITVGMGDAFGTPQNYLVLALTAFTAGATAQVMLDMVPFAQPR